MNVPKNLREVVNGDQSRYRLTEVYFLEIILDEPGHLSLAVMKSTGNTVAMIDKEVVAEVQKLLPPCLAKVSRTYAYVN